MLKDSFQQDLPPLLQQTFDAKLDRLEPTVLERLQVAAVIGQIVPYDLWQQVTGSPDSELISAIEAATGSNIFIENSSGTGYQFRHALLRESLYSRIIIPRRRSLHRQVAEALESEPQPDPDEVAFHYEEARDDRAIDWLVWAGERARHAYAWLTAVDRYGTALELIADDPERGQQRGWIHYRIGVLLRVDNPHRGLEHINTAKQISQIVDDQTLLAYSSFMHGMLLCFHGDIRLGIAQMRAGVLHMDALDVVDLERSGELLTTLMVDSKVKHVSPSEDLFCINPGWGTYALWLALAGHYEEVLALGRANSTHYHRYWTIDRCAALTD